MKIKISETLKNALTIGELSQVKKVMAEMKDDKDLKEYGKTLANTVGRDNFEILKVEAEIAKNARVLNYYGDETGKFDVWVSVCAFSNYKGFYIIEAYLSDIWALDGENTYELMGEMYIRRFSENK